MIRNSFFYFHKGGGKGLSDLRNDPLLLPPALMLCHDSLISDRCDPGPPRSGTRDAAAKTPDYTNRFVNPAGPPNAKCKSSIALPNMPRSASGSPERLTSTAVTRFSRRSTLCGGEAGETGGGSAGLANT